MKTLALTFIMMTMIAFSSMGQQADIGKMMQNPETRNEIFNTLMNSHEYMSEFMKTANGNQHAMMMMNQDKQMMNQNGNMEMNEGHQMMNQDKMMETMKNNPEMRLKMMKNMMNICEKDSVVRNQMVEMMAQHPELMQKCRQLMMEKGMVGKEPGANKMTPSKQSNN